MPLNDKIAAFEAGAVAGRRQNYSHTGLYTYALRIARTPPVNVHITKVGYKPTRHTTALLDALDVAEAMEEGPERDSAVASAFEAIYADEHAPLGLARRTLKSTRNQPTTINWSGSICDMAAYAVLCIGAGVARIERLNGNDPAEPGDRLVEVSDSAACSDRIDEWIAVNAPGVMQVKFDANGMHTFAIEKVCGREGGRLGFRIYQSYQGKYRLSDFLGLSNCRDLVEGSNLYGNKQKTASWAAVTEAANTFGNGKRLSQEEFVSEVKPILCGMVGDGVDNLGSLIGVASEPGSPVARSADKILLVICDRIDPTRFNANYEGFISGVGVSGGFVDLNAVAAG
ncbi:MAG: hypothetical protein ACFB03_15940 [Paracoccaceae bacterium]